MDEFDFIEKKAKRRFKLGAALLNLLSLGILLATLAVGAYYTFLFLFPYSEFNPFPPAAPAASTLPVASPTALEPESDELAAEAATEAAVEEATATNTPEATATDVPATATITPTRAPGSYYEIQPGSPVALDSSIFHPDLGCSFLGVAGQAFGLEDTPIPGLRVQVTGMLDGESVDKVGLTGAASQYGAGSYYEIVLGDEPIGSNESLEIQIIDEDGLAASDAFSFSTFASCGQNLILVNFKALP
jgi:hypothetical protein